MEWFQNIKYYILELNELELNEIDKYLTENFSEDEKRIFEQRIDQDPLLKEQVKKMKGLQAGIELNVLSEVLEAMDEWEDALQIGPASPVKSVSNNSTNKHQNWTSNYKTFNWTSPIWYKISIAALFLVVASLAIWIHQSTISEDKLINEKFIHYNSNIQITRSTSQTSLSPLKSRAYSLYEFKSYKEAAPLLEQVYLEENDELSIFLAASSYLKSHNLPKAEYCASLIQDETQRTQIQNDLELYKSLFNQ